MRPKVEDLHIVEEYQDGNTVIRFADNAIRTEPAEVDKVLNDYRAAGWAIVEECHARGEVV